MHQAELEAEHYPNEVSRESSHGASQVAASERARGGDVRNGLGGAERPRREAAPHIGIRLRRQRGARRRTDLHCSTATAARTAPSPGNGIWTV
ncbi:hypothetical protein EYF80_025230 [Liparis tanakae]|uniref:Uncharacterized protein n=1 Tax=Liparis tanakae TaxID=230148 RepID=A0A4Z2HI31_9TELE|nr:hypothetical protein EYF80_025230 [Liparis tanakae]